MASSDAVDRDRHAGDDEHIIAHRVVRDGSVWLCQPCGRTWPFPSPIPSTVEPCVPRRWGDQPIVYGGDPPGGKGSGS